MHIIIWIKTCLACPLSFGCCGNSTVGTEEPQQDFFRVAVAGTHASSREVWFCHSPDIGVPDADVLQEFTCFRRLPVCLEGGDGSSEGPRCAHLGIVYTWAWWSQPRVLLDSSPQGDLEREGNQDSLKLPFICLGEVFCLASTFRSVGFWAVAPWSIVIFKPAASGLLPAVKEVAA